MYLIPPIRFSPFQVKSVPSSSGQGMHPFYQPQTPSSPSTSDSPSTATPTQQESQSSR
ncbi:hypothetical protein DM02DRAFT_614315 [Periconia macrospinosa]|uniref:Uncharacterized protein n=1 Tax=Periconia macrospinosa TaxID=97972 RepID=A0A2V1DSX7_9PLEO|nr:hypothetical protein DM02DRAFT_614315 [Periconia macrospinosa]